MAPDLTEDLPGLCARCGCVTQMVCGVRNLCPAASRGTLVGVIDGLDLHRYRGFERLSVDLSPTAYIVGPNSAGKSTVIEAVALAETCRKRARRENPKLIVEHRREPRRAWAMPQRSNEDGEDPVRYEFAEAEAAVAVRWSDSRSLHMVWPVESKDDERQLPYFYLEGPGGAAVAPASLSSVFVVPVVTPLDRLEDVKSAQYVSRLDGTRLASRHFRNHAWEMQRTGHWRQFVDFSAAWLPEIELLDVELLQTGHLGIFYREGSSRVPKELAWAGDGIQIWLQLLWHLYRARDAQTIVLDEPEVYLHPDLQRRLVRLLDQLSVQVIMASHSADVIAEAPQDCIVWIDRRTNTSRRASSDRTLNALGDSLGTAFNLAIARAHRTRLVLATDCKDVRVLQMLARRVGALNIADDARVTFVALSDSAKWEGREGLGVALRASLPAGVPAVVLLERGLRPESDVARLRRVLAAPGVELTFLGSVEIENYLIDPDTLARVSGAAPFAIDEHINEVVDDLQSAAKRRYVAGVVASGTDQNATDSAQTAEAEFDEAWADRRNRRHLVRGSDVLDGINLWLEREGYRCVTPIAAARALKGPELPTELYDTLLWLDRLADTRN